MMFERFTPDARAVLESTTGCAISLGHNYIGTEHLLLALVAAEEAAGGGPLTKRGVTRDAVVREIRSQLASHVTDAEALRAAGVDPQALHDGAGQLGVDVQIGGLTPYEPGEGVPKELARVTPRTRTVLAMAEQARAGDVTCNDLLAAMLDEDGNLGVIVLERLGVSLPELRAEVGVGP
jgi:Clp amino terminal domain, pathogenicity island component